MLCTGNNSVIIHFFSHYVEMNNKGISFIYSIISSTNLAARARYYYGSKSTPVLVLVPVVISNGLRAAAAGR